MKIIGNSKNSSKVNSEQKEEVLNIKWKKKHVFCKSNNNKGFKRVKAVLKENAKETFAHQNHKYISCHEMQNHHRWRLIQEEEYKGWVY